MNDYNATAYFRVNGQDTRSRFFHREATSKSEFLKDLLAELELEGIADFCWKIEMG